MDVKAHAGRARKTLYAFLSCCLLFAQAQDGVGAERLQSAITELERLAQAEIQAGAVPGLAIVVVFQDEMVYAQGFGVRDTKTNEPVDADTVFQLASISKPVGSTVVAALVGEGVLSWDSRIADLDPDFAMFDSWVTREITLRDMYRTPERSARARGRFARGFGIHPRGGLAPPALPAPRHELSLELRLHQLRPDGGGCRGG